MSEESKSGFGSESHVCINRYRVIVRMVRRHEGVVENRTSREKLVKTRDE
jgi:hypothetical protein